MTGVKLQNFLIVGAAKAGQHLFILFKHTLKFIRIF